jgi:hypothetical protein
MVLMDLRRGSLLAWFINIRSRARGINTFIHANTRNPLIVAASRPNSKALVVCVVLAHPHMIFHPFMCGLRGGATSSTPTRDSYPFPYNHKKRFLYVRFSSVVYVIVHLSYCVAENVFITNMCTFIIQ